MHDAFICYNHADQDVAREIADRLKALGLDIWFDEDQRPGTEFPPQIKRAILHSRTLVLFVGNEGISGYQRKELNIADSDPDIIVIPAIFDGVGEGIVEQTKELAAGHNPIQFIESGVTFDSINALVHGITGRKMPVVRPQFGEAITVGVSLTGMSHGGKDLSVLPVVHRFKDKLEQLSWASFGEGLDQLAQQIENPGYRIEVDACFGINDAGLVMGTFLNSKMLGRKPLGYVKCGRKAEPLPEESFFPPLRPNPHLLLCDFEIKSGSSLKGIIETIGEQYEDPEIYFCAFGALVDVPPAKFSAMKDLVCVDNLASIALEDLFFGCVMNRPGIEPPMGLR